MLRLIISLSLLRSPFSARFWSPTLGWGFHALSVRRSKSGGSGWRGLSLCREHADVACLSARHLRSTDGEGNPSCARHPIVRGSVWLLPLLVRSLCSPFCSRFSCTGSIGGTYATRQPVFSGGYDFLVNKTDSKLSFGRVSWCLQQTRHGNFVASLGFPSRSG